MFNRVVMLGNLTRDCELRYLPTGGAICTTGLATNRKFKKQDGSQSEEVCFIDITFFGRTAEIANQYLGRGKKVLVEGRLKLDQWTDQNGVKRSKHSITVETLQMIDSKDSTPQHENFSEHSGQHSPTPSRTHSSASPANTPRTPINEPITIPEIDINDDEITVLKYNLP